MNGRVVGTIKWVGPELITDIEARPEELQVKFYGVAITEVVAIGLIIYSVIALFASVSIFLPLWFTRSYNYQTESWGHRGEEVLNVVSCALGILFWRGPRSVLHPKKMFLNGDLL